MAMLTLKHGVEGEFVPIDDFLLWVRDHPLVRRGRKRILISCIWGAAGIGKCLRGDTDVLINDRLVPIATLWDEHAGAVTFDGEGWWAEPRQELLTVALDADGTGTPRPQRVTHLYRQRVREQGRRVKLADGNEIVMTAAHRLLGLDGWRRDLAVGDKVAVPARLPRTQTPAPLDRDLATLLAWQIAEGCELSQPYTVTISQADRDALKRVRAAADRMAVRAGVELNSMPIFSDPSGVSALSISSKAYRAYAEKLGYVWGRASAEKTIPNIILTADDEAVRTFIGKYVACEGHIDPVVGNLQISSASRAVIDQLSYLLRRFGIWGQIHRKRKQATNGRRITRTYWELTIGGSSLRRFAAEIAIPHAEKQAALELVCERVCNTNVEGVPVGDILLRAAALTGLPRRHFGCDSRDFKPNKGMSRARAGQVLTAFRAILDGSAETAYREPRWQKRLVASTLRAFEDIDRVAFTALTDELARRVETDVCWTRVVAVEPVQLDEWVYDLEVGDAHNYIAAGIVTHNTEIIAQLCAEHELAFKTYHPAHDRDGGDIVGVQMANPMKPGEMMYALPAWLPTEKDPPGILLIDEINRANELVLAGLMELLGEGTISQSGYVLPEGWQIVCVANPGEIVYAVRDMDEAMVDRMIHYAPGFDLPGWVEWARSAGVNQRVIDFVLRYPPDLLNPQKSIIKVGELGLPMAIADSLRATPRSLEYISALLPDETPLAMVRVLAEGMLGLKDDAAALFVKHWQDDVRPLSYAQVESGEYRKPLHDWLAAGETDLVRGTSEGLVGELVSINADPARRNKEEIARTAGAVGRYLADLPAELREEAFASIGRSANGWLAPLRGVCEAAIQGSSEKPEGNGVAPASGETGFSTWSES